MTSSPKKMRTFRPRDPIVVSPIAVSQFTASALFGFKNARAFLDFVRERHLTHSRNGKTVIVACDDLRSAIRDLQSVTSEISRDGDLDTPEAVLALVKRRRA